MPRKIPLAKEYLRGNYPVAYRQFISGRFNNFSVPSNLKRFIKSPLLEIPDDEGGGAIDPDTITGLVRWYKADSFIGYTDGQSCGRTGIDPWVDQKGSGQDARSAAGAIWKDSTNYGKPYVEFVLQAFGNADSGNLGDFTVIAACKKTSTSSFLIYHGITGNQIRRSFSGDNTTLFYDGTGGGQAASAFANPNNFLVVVVRRSGTTVSFRENLTSRGSFTYSSATFATNEIGSISNGSFIDIGEILIYNNALDDATLDSLYTDYLKPRFTILP